MLNGLSVNNYVLVVFMSLFSLQPAFTASAKNSNEQNINLQEKPINQQDAVYKLHPVLALMAGASISQTGQSQTMAPLDLCSYTYQPSHKKTTDMLWGGFIGSKVKKTPKWLMVTGLSYYQPNSLATKGTLTQGADAASSDSYNYSYKIQSQQLLVEGRFYWIDKPVLQPFVTLGLGAAFNKVSNYYTNVSPLLAFTPEFSNHNQTNFTYAIGAGIDIPISTLFNLGVGYRFTDLGAANTGRSQIDLIPIANSLQQSHLYANQIFAQFSFMPSIN